MTKSIFIIFTCNPYLAVLQKRLFDKFWGDEVDEVLIGINGRNKKMLEFIRDLWVDEPKVKVIEIMESESRQGIMLNMIYKYATGEIIIIMDSDNFIYQKGIIDKMCNKIEQGYSSVGSLGLHAHPALVAEMFYKAYGTVRLNPFMAFFKKEIIDKSEIDFRTFNYELGQQVDFWGTPMPCKGWIDVMGAMCLRYFKHDFKYFTITENAVGYLHGGGLSSVHRRHWKSMDVVDGNVFVQRDRGPAERTHYWVMVKAVYDVTKAQVDGNYNAEYEKGFEQQFRDSGTEVREISLEANKMKDRFKELFEL